MSELADKVRRITTVVSIAGVIGTGIAWDALDINTRALNLVRYRGKTVEMGYINPFQTRKDIVVNKKGNLETYIVSMEKSLPLLEGENGPQLGTMDYVWGNIGAAEREQKVYEGFANLRDSKKKELVGKEWTEMSASEKYEIIKSDLGEKLSNAYRDLAARIKGLGENEQ